MILCKLQNIHIYLYIYVCVCVCVCVCTRACVLGVVKSKLYCKNCVRMCRNIGKCLANITFIIKHWNMHGQSGCVLFMENHPCEGLADISYC